VTLYIEGFSHFVTFMTASIASGWSKSCRVGLSPTGKRRLSTAHTQTGLSQFSKPASQLNPDSWNEKATNRPLVTSINQPIGEINKSNFERQLHHLILTFKI
jgi:hypothetical protein